MRLLSFVFYYGNYRFLTMVVLKSKMTYHVHLYYYYYIKSSKDYFKLIILSSKVKWQNIQRFFKIVFWV